MAEKNNNSTGNVHKEHRSRMREKFAETGFKGWSRYEILEFMLYNVYAQKDTNPMAHSLMEYNGNSLRRMFENAVDNRMAEDIHGIGEKTVLYIRTLKEFMEYYLREELLEKRIRIDRDSFKDILRGIRFSEYYESVYMLCMDCNMYLKSIINLTEESSETAARISIERIVSCAVRAKAANVILMHNHPMGSTKPSLDDINMTSKSSDALNSVGSFLVDHYIVSGTSLSSVRMYMMNMNR